MTPLKTIVLTTELTIAARHLIAVINEERPVQTNAMRRAIRQMEQAIVRAETARSDDAGKEQTGLFG